MRIRTKFSNRARHPRRRRLALLGTSVAACFAIGVAQAAPVQSTDPGWQSPPAEATPQAGTGWTQNAAQAPVEQDYAQLPKAEQGGPGHHPITAAPAKQGGPGRSAPDELVDYSTQLANPSARETTTGGNALVPDRAALAADIQFPPYSTDLSGDAIAALNGLAASAGNLSGSIVITARADPVEQHARDADVSMARAQSVANYLAQAGVDPQRIVVRAIGTTQPRVNPRVCEGMIGPSLAACLSPDRSVTVQVGRLEVGMAGTAVPAAD